MGVIIDFEPCAGRGQAAVGMTAAGVKAARLLADIEIAKARMDVDAVTRKMSDPLAVEIHAIRRALALLDLTLHTSLGSRL